MLATNWKVFWGLSWHKAVGQRQQVAPLWGLEEKDSCWTNHWEPGIRNQKKRYTYLFQELDGAHVYCTEARDTNHCDSCSVSSTTAKELLHWNVDSCSSCCIESAAVAVNHTITLLVSETSHTHAICCLKPLPTGQYQLASHHNHSWVPIRRVPYLQWHYSWTSLCLLNSVTIIPQGENFLLTVRGHPTWKELPKDSCVVQHLGES